MSNKEFLNWIADRLVHVYGESPNVDFVHKLRAIANAESISEAEKQEPVAWWIPKAEQFCLPNANGERPFAKAWEPLYTHPQPKPEQDEAYRAAAYLAKAIFDSLYANKEPYVSGKVVWELCDTTVGVITQIDNMVSQFSTRHQRPKRRAEHYEWVGLTDEERNHARQTITYSQLAMTAGEWTEEVQIETERRLKEKNT